MSVCLLSIFWDSLAKQGGVRDFEYMVVEVSVQINNIDTSETISTVYEQKKYQGKIEKTYCGEMEENCRLR